MSDPDYNIYRDGERMISSFYNSLPQGFNLTEKELQMIRKAKPKQAPSYFQGVPMLRQPTKEHPR